MFPLPRPRGPIDFDPTARQLYDQYSAEFSMALLLAATERAREFHTRVILPEFVHGARADVYEQQRQVSGGPLRKHVALLLAGALLGAGVQGFVTEMLGQPDGSNLIIYALLTLVGLLLGRLGVR